MKRPRIYLDTSVINFVFADDAPDFQRATIDFFEHCAVEYELYVSEVVLYEIERDPNLEHRQQLLSVIAEHNVQTLPTEDVHEVERLAERYIEEAALPESKPEDAMHAAYATVHEIDILLSWNFKHLANLSREAKILAVNLSEGYRYPLRLVSPLEVQNV